MNPPPRCYVLTPHAPHRVPGDVDFGDVECPGVPNLAEPVSRDLGELIAEEAARNPEFAAGLVAAELAAQQPLSRDDPREVSWADAIRNSQETFADIERRRVELAKREAALLADEELDVDLPTLARPGCKVWIVSEDPAARDARVRADERRRVALEIAEAIETHHAADDLTAVQSARIARHHAAAPAERIQDAPTDTVGTQERPRASVVIQGNLCCGGNGDEASCEECR